MDQRNYARQGHAHARSRQNARLPFGGVRVYVVDDHALFREALLGVLSEAPRVQICGASASAEDALDKVPAARPDLIFVDLSLPQMNGFDFAVQIRRRCPNLDCVMVSGHCNRTLVERARAAGFSGYVFKGDAGRLKSALLEAVAGNSSFPDFREPVRHG